MYTIGFGLSPPSEPRSSVLTSQLFSNHHSKALADVDRVEVKHQEEIAAIEISMVAKREAEQAKLQKKQAAKRAKRAKQKGKKGVVLSPEEVKAEEAKLQEEEAVQQRALEARLALIFTLNLTSTLNLAHPRPRPRPRAQPSSTGPLNPLRRSWIRKRRLPLA